MSDDFTISPEGITMPFSILDANGAVVFRDALHFENFNALIQTTEGIRSEMRRERYEALLAALAAAVSDPPISPGPDAQPDAPEDEPTDGP